MKIFYFNHNERKPMLPLRTVTVTFYELSFVLDGEITYYINNGKIESINIPESVLENTAAGTYKIGTPAFDAYAYKYQEFMKKVLERQNDWSNVVYHLA